MTINKPGHSHIEGLSLEEKASLTSGQNFWWTKSAGDVPAIMVTDGPHGMRKQEGSADHLGIEKSIPATCFPPAVGLGSSFDVDLIERVGEALGDEARIEDVAVLLGPGINIKRSPLCGRNFEYFSEDPILSGDLGAAWVRGVQSRGVGTSLKHFAANNQETDRLRVSSEIDPRTLREIYLRGFERVVKDEQPWTVMCSYNRINGVYASQDPWLLTGVLRKEWGFEGLVVSDWGAVVDRVEALKAGLDLEMPSTRGTTDAEVVAAVRSGDLDEHVLDTAAARVAHLALRSKEVDPLPGPLDVDAHHALAREAAARSLVLLKNDDQILPLAAETRLAVIGAFAEDPRYQGAGSSLIHPTRLDRALDEIRAIATGEVSFAAGFSIAETVTAEETANLKAEAVDAAAAAEVAVVFLGLPARLESEGYDRTSIDLPADQLELLDAVVEANPRTVVVLSNGAVVALPFADRVPAILEGWLLGQAGGGGTADVLYGVVNPSAKLTETLPVRIEDTPAFGNFPGEFGKVVYGEGLFVGYRWYDARRIEVVYPFGHGLSYTTFAYGEATASELESGDIEVRVEVTNTGGVAGREVVQVYTAIDESIVSRPVKELKAFASVALEAGESKQAVLVIRRDDLAFWDTRVDQFVVESGTYRIHVGASSQDLRAGAEVKIGGDPVRPEITEETTLIEALENPSAEATIHAIRDREPESPLATIAKPSTVMLIGSFPLGRLKMMGLSQEHIDEILVGGNAK